MKQNKKISKGFTLIELLVVIAILAILMVAVVITINPAQLLASARDSTRLSDMQAIKTSIDLFVTDGGGRGSLGVPYTIYLSIPDQTAKTTNGTDCSGIGLGGANFHCAASSTYQKSDGTGWIPINFSQISSGAPLTSLPKDPINTTSSDEYYAYETDGTNYKVTSAPEANKDLPNINNYAQGTLWTLQGGFPQNWIRVPGNSTFGTKDFFVMKYDAKCSDNYGNNLTSPDTGYQTYNNSLKPCVAPSYSITSAPDGYPIANIAETTAKQYCQSIGAHLMTNDEWMTIATNATNQPSNWSGGSVGSGSMPRGNSNSSWAQSDNSIYGYAGSTNTSTYSTSFINLRTINLSNGSIIWDFAGNVFQEVQRSNMNQGDNQTTEPSPAYTGTSWTWGDFPSWTSWSSDPTTALTKSQVSPPNGSWTYAQGMGQLLGWGPGGTGGGTNAFIRGGNWNFGGNVGVFTLHLYWNTGSTSSDVGFRCAR